MMAFDSRPAACVEKWLRALIQGVMMTSASAPFCPGSGAPETRYWRLRGQHGHARTSRPVRSMPHHNGFEVV
jgi:hypothetical protein